jgi:fucose permease
MHAKRNAIILMIIVYATMTLFGLVENIKGVSFPLIKVEFNAAYDEQGGLVSLTWFGYVLFCLVAGFFLSRFGIKKAMLSGYVLIGLGTMAALVMPGFWTVTGALLLVNAGFGFFEVGTNALATQIFRTRTAVLLSLMHFFYGVGAVLAPKAAGLLTSGLGLGWRQVYLAALVPVALVGLAAMASRFPRSADSAPAVPSPVTALPQTHIRPSFGVALRNPLVWSFSLALGFMEVVEFGAANWGGLHLKDVYGLDPRTVGASFVSMFYLLFTISRLLGGFAVERIGYMRSLLGASVALVLIYAAGFGLGQAGIWLLPVSGLFVATLWPTLMALAMHAFGSDAPVMTSAVIVISGAINAVFQLAIGLTNRWLGEAWGYRSCLLYAIIVILALLQLRRKLPHS